MNMKYDKLQQKWLFNKHKMKTQAEEMMATVIIKGRPVFKKYGFNKVILFGSISEGISSRNSDIDMLVIPLLKDQYWQCQHELEQIIEFPIDLYTQDDDPKFVDKILKRGKVIYEI